ncbi:YheC/YheD family protein [Tepidibacillus fermentans]|uniref:YheC/D-like protein n=1 Tax=Tepidibacillus fermentans TaxID=1281767 RepID=A0A4R3KJ30_9BACI|nr:YheC/YheD family protein [Tepidibacillus fermentans]TCS83595.1 YheC/D-like protein [Tepidibacillus fermentans]
MKIVQIQVDQEQNQPRPIIYANIATINRLSLPLNQPITLHFGKKNVEVRVSISTNTGNLIRIPSELAAQLLLPNGIQLHAKFDKEKGLFLGPIFGILIQTVNPKQPQTPFGKLTEFLKEVALLARNQGILFYVFTIQDIYQQTQMVKGWFYSSNQWEPRIFPLPDVIYNRISSRNQEKKFKVKITELQKQIPFFNEHFLNKWQVYEMLKKTPIQDYMPETNYFKGNQSIKEMIAKYPIIYLKPTNGALGRGIIKIEHSLDQYIVQYSRINGASTFYFKNLNKLLKHLYPRLHSEPYLIQEGLNLIQFNRRPIDFRILVQKNGQGLWSITSMVCRIANDQQFVSNLARGGTQANVMETIRSANPELSKKIKKDHFRKLALLIAKNLEESTSGHFAELGIDLGLDNKGKIWLLEVNSKPSKTEDTALAGPRPSVNRLIQYVRFLTGFPEEKKRHRRK